MHVLAGDFEYLLIRVRYGILHRILTLVQGCKRQIALRPNANSISTHRILTVPSSPPNITAPYSHRSPFKFPSSFPFSFPIAMADPVGIVTSALHAIHKVYNLIQKIKGASEKIQTLQEEAVVLEGILPQIMAILAREPHSECIAVLISRAEGLNDSVDRFVNAATKVAQEKRKVKKLRWIFKGDEAKELAEGFKSFYGSLSAVCNVYSTQFPDHVQSAFSHMDTKLQHHFLGVDGQFEEVHTRLDQTRIALLDAITELQPAICMSIARELRVRANEQKRGGTHAFDKSSVYYDSDDDLSEADANAASGPCMCCLSHLQAENGGPSSCITPFITHSMDVDLIPPLRREVIRPCEGCRCRCHRAPAIQGIPRSLAAIIGSLYVRIPFPRRFWPGVVECDVETCKKDWLMDVKYWFPSWFTQIEMDLRFESLPVHFCIQTPRAAPLLWSHCFRWVNSYNRDLNHFRKLLGSRQLSVNDVDLEGRSLLHCLLWSLLGEMDCTITEQALHSIADAVSLCLNAGAQPEWQCFKGLSVTEYAVRSILYTSSLRLRSSNTLSRLESIILRPLFHESLDDIYVRLGVTELHKRVCLPGYPPLTPGVINSLLPQLNTPDWSGNTPLFYAILHAPQTIDMLLDAGADLQLVRDPLHLATSIESPDLDSRAIEILVRAGVDVNGRNLEGETPLICATVYTEHSKNFEIISKFDGKLDWNARDKWGNTALDYALEYERPKEVIRLLKRHSALDIFEHDGGSVAQVKSWTWTYGEIGYRCPWCQCWPRCGKKAQRDRYHSDKDEENLVMPGAFR